MQRSLICAPAFADSGPITELIVLTAARVNAMSGPVMRSRLLAVVIAGNKGVKKLQIDEGHELVALLKAYDPPTFSVVGTDDETEIVENLKRAIAAIPRGGVA